MEIGIQINVKGSAEAVVLYQEAFGATLGYHVKNSDGSFFHAELELDGHSLVALSESSGDIGYQLLEKYSPECYPTMNFGVILPDQSAVQQAFDVLSQGGVVVMAPCQLPWSDFCTSVIDRFGVFWYLSVLQHRPDDDELDIP